MSFDPLDFQPNSVGVLVVRVIRLKDIMRTLDCTEARAHEVVREIRGETSADGAHAFVLPSQLAAWTYRQARKRPSPASVPFETVLVNDTAGTADALKRAAARGGAIDALRSELQHGLKALRAHQVQPGATALSVEQAAARLGCSRSQVFEELRAGRLARAEKVGRKTMVTLASVEARTGAPEAKSRPRRAARPARQSGASIKAEILKLTSRS